MAIVRRLVLIGTLALVSLVMSPGNASRTAASQTSSAQSSASPPATAGAGPRVEPRVDSRTEPKSELAYSLPPDKLAQAIALNRIRVSLEIAGSLWGLVVLWWLLASGTATRLDAWACERAKWRWLQGAAFFAILFILLSLAGLPLEAIAHAAGLHYRISVQAWPAWLGDQAKGLGVSLAIGVPVALFFNWIVRQSPRRYWLWTWLVSLPLILVSVFLAPLVLDPIFNKFTPLEANHPRLAARLEEVAARTGTRIPPGRMFLMNASEKSNGINAYVTGIGSSKRFVMWDTTMDRMPDDEIMFIFGHESGHYMLNHIPKGLALMMVGLLFTFWICAHLAEWMIRRFGGKWHVSTVGSRAGFLTLLFALSIAEFLSTPVSNAISRHFEHEADVVRAGGDSRAGPRSAEDSGVVVQPPGRVLARRPIAESSCGVLVWQPPFGAAACAVRRAL